MFVVQDKWCFVSIWAGVNLESNLAVANFLIRYYFQQTYHVCLIFLIFSGGLEAKKYIISRGVVITSDL